MRGEDRRTGQLFSYVDLESRVRADHPLRTIRGLVDQALAALSADFDAIYSRVGRPSIAPERLLRAMLLQCFYSVRSERQLMERLEFDLLFRWFVGLGIDDQVWNHSTFSKNRDRLLAGDVAAEFLAEVLDQPQVRRLLSSEHFSVDGSLVEGVGFDEELPAQARSGRPAEQRPQPRGGERGRATGTESGMRLPRRAARQRQPRLDHRSRRPAVPQRSRSGSEALLRRARADGEPARPGVDAELTRASGHAERLAALAMLDRLPTAASMPGTSSWNCASAG